MASGRIFLLLRYDLNKKSFHRRSTVKKSVSWIPGCNPKVSASNPITQVPGSKSIYTKNVSKAFLFSESADVCAAWLGQKWRLIKRTRRCEKKSRNKASILKLKSFLGLKSEVKCAIIDTVHTPLKLKCQKSLSIRNKLKVCPSVAFRWQTIEYQKAHNWTSIICRWFGCCCGTRFGCHLLWKKPITKKMTCEQPKCFPEQIGGLLSRSYRKIIKERTYCSNLPSFKLILGKHNLPRRSQSQNLKLLIRERTYIHFQISIAHNSTFRSHRHRLQVSRWALRCSGNVELNPGPAIQDRGSQEDQDLHKDSSILVTTYNVRGLNDEKKLRHFINKVYKGCHNKNNDYITCLQETYVTSEGKIPYLWRGNFHLTPGGGNSCGCVTLLSSHLDVAQAIDVDDRAHVLAVQRVGESNVSLIVANIYAPNPNNQEKIEFFEKVFEQISALNEKFNCDNVLVLGDFNLVFNQNETKNRNITVQEKRVAKCVKDLMSQWNLTDGWSSKASFTWRRPNSSIFSTIDRILYSSAHLKLNMIKENWSFSYSDHAAVRAGFSLCNKKPSKRARITRLDPSLARNKVISEAIIKDYEDMLGTMPALWDPHMKLEFAKVCIRTVVEKAQAERKSRERAEEDEVNEELEAAVNKLASGEARNENTLIEYIEDLRARKSVLVEEKGARLAEKLGTKWHNEGEKSTKYFMRLLQRSSPDHLESLSKDDGSTITEPELIEAAIVDFYKKLYEEGDRIQIEDDHEFFNNIIPISEQEDKDITRKMTADELRETLHSCSDSAPGPDGIPYSIIGLVWPTFGKILCDAWNYSLEIGSLSASHRTSYLRLIPKVGKDLKKLTNWRPITLSNCDHKLITKTYAKRLCLKLASKIEERQTAYLKGRLINDNIRAILSTIELSNSEQLNGLLIALDAKKAFDSVDHNYIEKCLARFGCSRFVPIFRTLYNSLKTDIIINGKIINGFNIRRGVKQGDALSCIIFIMCMEPLLKNIELNPEIRALESRTLNKPLPKAYAYADDVNAVLIDSEVALQAVFTEYEKLTAISGLELNADKTELMRMGNEVEATYNIRYKGKQYRITSNPVVKINGIIFQRHRQEMLDANVESIIEKMDRHFRQWSRRSLTTLGKILIAKTFGISQLIYLLQTTTINDVHFKKINQLLFKFIWNRHYLASKAPERVKREIVCKSITNGGYGMLNIKQLDDSLKLRALGRLLVSKHPFNTLVKERLNLESYFNPEINLVCDHMIARAVDLLKSDRNKLWGNVAMDSDRHVLAAIGQEKLKKIISIRGQGSLDFFVLWNRGARKMKDISLQELARLERHIDHYKINKLRLAIRYNLRPTPSFLDSYCIAKSHKFLGSLTSKEFRMARCEDKPHCEFKIGLRLSEAASLTWSLRLSKLTSTKHKNTLLRAMHGDIYTQSKLYRFGMGDSETCPRCDQVEDLRHKLLECDYINRIWRVVDRHLKTTNINIERDIKSLAAYPEATLTALTLTAEIIQMILQLRPEQNYLTHPKQFVERAIKNLKIKEGNKKIRGDFIQMLGGN